MKHLLERVQVLPIDLDEAWAFFSTPRNLGLITPPELGLVMREPFDGKPAHAGQLINYTVKPLFGIPLRWVTLIEEVEAPHVFVDTQVKGPYRLWRHRHTFTSVPGGVEMRDRIEYELPLGPLGEITHALLVRKQLSRIFEHRRSALERLFPQDQGTKAPSSLFRKS